MYFSFVSLAVHIIIHQYNPALYDSDYLLISCRGLRPNGFIKSISVLYNIIVITIFCILDCCSCLGAFAGFRVCWFPAFRQTRYHIILLSYRFSSVFRSPHVTWIIYHMLLWVLTFTTTISWSTVFIVFFLALGHCFDSSIDFRQRPTFWARILANRTHEFQHVYTNVIGISNKAIRWHVWNL